MTILIKRLFFSCGYVTWSANMLVSILHRGTGIAAVVLLTVGFFAEQKFITYYGVETLFHPTFMAMFFVLIATIHYIVGLNKP